MVARRGGTPWPPIVGVTLCGHPMGRHRVRPLLDENVGAQFIESVSAGSMNRTPTGRQSLRFAATIMGEG